MSRCGIESELLEQSGSAGTTISQAILGPGKDSHLAQKVSITRKCHYQKLQTNPWYREERQTHRQLSVKLYWPILWRKK